MSKKPWAGIAAACFALVLGLSAMPASADVRYDFQASSSFEIGGEQFAGSFSVVLPDFVTFNTPLAVDSLLSCSVTVTPTAPATCGDQAFLFDVSPPFVTVAFGVKTSANPGTSIYYYFDNGAFSAPGVYQSQIFGASQFATLTVSAVPEPATAASLLAGLGLLAARRRRPRA